MKRIAIVGCPGSGKTTVAFQMKAITGLPIEHLDYYYHQLKYGYYDDKEVWIKKAEVIIKKPKWIMDGNYSSTFEQRFKRADLIIFFDYPRWLTMYRVIKRRWQFNNKKRLEMPDDWVEKVDWEFLKYVWRFKGKSHSKITAALEKFSDTPVVVLKNPSETENYLKSLTYEKSNN